VNGAYYNEIDPYAAQWLRNLIAGGHIAPGDVDERSILDVKPDDLRGYTQCHFFAGIAGWSHALRLSLWPDDRPVWTGSCPCQPFSAAGKGKASGDERHLWPHWFELIRACRPPIIFGEQVEAAIGWGWLDLVFSDLEEEGYAVGAAVLPACSVGAPHIRQRLWFVADSEISGRIEGQPHPRRGDEGTGPEGQFGRAAKHSDVGELADSECPEWGPHGSPHGGDGNDPVLQGQKGSSGIGERGVMGNADAGCERRGEVRATPGEDQSLSDVHDQRRRENGELADAQCSGVGAGFCGDERPGKDTQAPHHCGSHWSDLVWLPCTDGKQRPTQPGIFPLAHGIPGRVAKLRAAGNAIVPQVAAEFIKATMP
jgi:DNA (cytosine-5)-methyltransferase 1